MNALLLTMLTMTCHQSGETLPPPMIDVAPLIRDLGGDYKARTDATRKLSAMGEDARPALLKAATADDREVSRRAEMLIFWLDQARRKRAVAMIDAAFPAPLPCIDFAWWSPERAFCADNPCREALWPYYERASSSNAPKTCDVTKEGWWCYRTATRALCVDMAEAGIPLTAIRMMVAELAAREAKWMEGYRGTR